MKDAKFVERRGLTTSAESASFQGGHATPGNVDDLRSLKSYFESGPPGLPPPRSDTGVVI
jgi:hypothetical protein